MAPDVVVQGDAVLVVQIGRIHHGTVEVELELVVGAVAQAYRPRVVVTGEVGELFLVYLRPAVYPVERLESTVGVAADVLEPAHEVVCFLVKPEPGERVEDKRRVPRPSVAVVPVALPPDGLGQTHGRSGHQGSGRVVDHKLESQRRAVDHLPPSPPVCALGYPPPPVVERLLQHILESGP